MVTLLVPKLGAAICLNRPGFDGDSDGWNQAASLFRVGRLRAGDDQSKLQIATLPPTRSSSARRAWRPRTLRQQNIRSLSTLLTGSPTDSKRSRDVAPTERQCPGVEDDSFGCLDRAFGCLRSAQMGAYENTVDRETGFDYRPRIADAELAVRLTATIGALAL